MIETPKQWIEWPGGECPVGPDALVDVKRRNGAMAVGFRADNRTVLGRWDRADHPRHTDIIAYRVVPS